MGGICGVAVMSWWVNLSGTGVVGIGLCAAAAFFQKMSLGKNPLTANASSHQVVESK